MRISKDVGVEAATLASLGTATDKDLRMKSKFAHVAEELIATRNSIRCKHPCLSKEIALDRINAAIQHLADASFNATAALHANEQVSKNL